MEEASANSEIGGKELIEGVHRMQWISEEGIAPNGNAEVAIDTSVMMKEESDDD